jgi:transposase InsO family protein
MGASLVFMLVRSLILSQVVVVLVVGLESLQVVSLLGVLPLMLNTEMRGVVALRWRVGTIHGSPFVVLVLLQAERVGFVGVVTVVVFVEVALIGEMLWIVVTPLLSKWLSTGFTLLVLTPVLSSLFAHVLVFEFQVGDLKNIWLIDSGCSRHMTGDKGWFSSLVPVVTKWYITFGDNARGCVLSKGEIKVSDKITLRRVALVQSLGYNLLSVSQLLDEGFEVLFRPGGSRILNSRGDLVCMVVPEGHVFRADFSQSSGVERCFLASSSSELWKWHRKLGHLSFDLLSRLSKLNLVRGFLRLRLEKELVCAQCRHAKMVASSHPPLTDVMTERPCELLHMDLVGPARVRSTGGKWYVLVVVDDYSRYAWVFFLEDKGETFGFVRDLVLRLRNERHRDAIRAIRSNNGSEFRNSHFETFCHDLGLEHQFSSLYMPPQNGVVERKNRTLCEMARTMLDEHRTPRRFWAEAVNTACHVSNRIYLSA